ncbi:cyclic nucleotide-binding domain-containing protein [Desulfosediminicola sp.]|uniref:cyclic nucleotide-binding domain-containing protein n=1 Tax=Desulfosediminicola sp. TaxID=2886825 RepID=UPI003AF2BFE2
MSSFESDRSEESSGIEKEVVILMTDMVGYSHLTAHMRPNGIRDFIVDYHRTIQEIVAAEDEMVRVEPLAGDGALIIYEKRADELESALCTRATVTALRLADAVDSGLLPPTRVGLHFGEIIEAKLNGRSVKFGASFAIAARLEELCDYFGSPLLMDQNVALRYQGYKGCEEEFVSVGRVMLDSFAEPLQIYTVYKPGLHNIPKGVDRGLFRNFTALKGEAMRYFCGEATAGLAPDFPRAVELLTEAQNLYMQMSGSTDRSTERILEYIRETPAPDSDFLTSGMRLSKKGRESLGARLFHLSEELLKAMNQEFYHALVVDTAWEKYFKLEWRKMGENIITINDSPDGVYFIDSGEVVTLNEHDEEITTLTAGTIFGEMAYFNKEKRRTATVRATTDVVIRRISSEDFEKIPVIVKIFERIAMARR